MPKSADIGFSISENITKPTAGDGFLSPRVSGVTVTPCRLGRADEVIE